MRRVLLLLMTLFMIFSLFVGCTKEDTAIQETGSNELSNEANEANENHEANEEDSDNNNSNETSNNYTALADEVIVEDESVTFVDALDQEVTIQKKPERVICLFNSYLDLWYLSGGEVIGRIESRDKVPEGAMEAEIVGTMTSPNMEKIISLEPDLVILRPGMRGQSEIIPILEENEIPYLGIEYDNLEQYLYAIRLFTAINERDDLYQKNGLDITKQVEEIVNKVPKDEEPTVLLMFASTRNVSVKFQNSFVGDMLHDLGTVNIAYDAQLTNEEMEVFSMEKVIERDPEYILVQTMGDVDNIKDKLIKDVESNPAWESLTAVKEGKYIFLPKDLYLYKPNEKYPEAYRGLAEILYPDTF
ncbi:ABC transporter substrate-binding protein [Alkaliphilus pronyensis]|nr:ABC transporter substrate-binding protein [Alkaliphilus pronyensis]